VAEIKNTMTRDFVFRMETDGAPKWIFISPGESVDTQHWPSVASALQDALAKEDH
jgi:hypothetical protein